MTTPQDIALLDARRGAEMFRSVQVPVSKRNILGLRYHYSTVLKHNAAPMITNSILPVVDVCTMVFMGGISEKTTISFSKLIVT